MTTWNIMFCFWLGFALGGMVLRMSYRMRFPACIILGALVAIIGRLIEVTT